MTETADQRDKAVRAVVEETRQQVKHLQEITAKLLLELEAPTEQKREGTTKK